MRHRHLQLLVLAVLATPVVVRGDRTIEPVEVRKQQPFAPARRVSGSIPNLPAPNTVGWVQEAVEVIVEESGRARSVDLLKGTPGSSLLAPAVGTWAFRPAAVGTKPVATRVLVTGVFRPPMLLNGPAAGSAPVSLGVGSREVPAPTDGPVPEYPPRARGGGVAIVELLIDREGRVQTAAAVNAAAGFDTVAVEAARRWKFRPAVREGVSVPAYVYMVFGFREPVTGAFE